MQLIGDDHPERRMIPVLLRIGCRVQAGEDRDDLVARQR